jgi:hypothetical protein
MSDLLQMKQDAQTVFNQRDRLLGEAAVAAGQPGSTHRTNVLTLDIASLLEAAFGWSDLDVQWNPLRFRADGQEHKQLRGAGVERVKSPRV